MYFQEYELERIDNIHLLLIKEYKIIIYKLICLHEITYFYYISMRRVLIILKENMGFKYGYLLPFHI